MEAIGVDVCAISFIPTGAARRDGHRSPQTITREMTNTWQQPALKLEVNRDLHVAHLAVARFTRFVPILRKRNRILYRLTRDIDALAQPVDRRCAGGVPAHVHLAFFHRARDCFSDRVVRYSETIGERRKGEIGASQQIKRARAYDRIRHEKHLAKSTLH
ncbi:hypothetical protein PQR64_33840 [Paraburkholderia phytofirmans]|uniref:hypothetical protein n=1 Tax=Paraburkholderia phytofirmans TaxID=261302 RepID=UPI0038BA7BB4